MLRWSRWSARAGSGGLCRQCGPEGLQERQLEAPDLRHIPPLKRRRLSPLARAVFHTLNYCDPDAELPLVFSSAMGEINRTHGLLHQLAVAGDISPAAFSLSVHNAIAGLWSVQRNNTRPMQALAPRARSPVPALLEAIGQLHEGCDSVALVFAEEDYPDFYAPWLESPAGPSALALCLGSGERDAVARLRLQFAGGDSAPDSGGNAGALDRLLAGEPAVRIDEGGCSWMLEHVA
ncbi:beta-ketoacyl synthase chain length factor [Parahaliea aestuarii]